MNHFVIRLLTIFVIVFSLPAFPITILNKLTLEANNGFSTIITTEQLNALPQISFTTTTPWTNGSATYSGPALKDVLTFFPQGYKSIDVYALNGYLTQISVETIESNHFIFATHRDDKLMSVRNKGPFWILVNFTHHPEYEKNIELQASLAWQISKIKANY